MVLPRATRSLLAPGRSRGRSDVPQPGSAPASPLRSRARPPGTAAPRSRPSAVVARQASGAPGSVAAGLPAAAARRPGREPTATQRPSGRARRWAEAQAEGGGGSPGAPPPIRPARARRAGARATAPPGPCAQPPAPTLLSRAGRGPRLRRASSSSSSCCCSRRRRLPRSVPCRAGAASPSGAAPPPCARRECSRRGSASNLGRVAQRGGAGRGRAGRPGPQASAASPGSAGPEPEPAAASANLPAQRQGGIRAVARGACAPRGRPLQGRLRSAGRRCLLAGRRGPGQTWVEDITDSLLSGGHRSQLLFAWILPRASAQDSQAPSRRCLQREVSKDGLVGREMLTSALCVRAGLRKSMPSTN
ncbi:uncharacterized protein RBU33_000867 [Hipposideros larvatus]